MIASVESFADEAERRAGRVPEPTERRLTGSQFILDTPAEVPAVWGDGGRVLWARGEPLLIVGPAGVGKTTLAQQLTLARHGAGPGELLGLPVSTDARRVLYVAADRPAQAARSFRRMVGEGDRAALDHLAVHRGPLPFDLAATPAGLAEYAQSREAGTVVIDSLKDVALDLSKDETGSRVNLALQECVARGIEVAALHHQRKEQAGAGKPRSLADVYGSTWITAGAGSVIGLWGEPGDPVVELRHLKQPAAEVGPMRLAHDHAHGATSIHDAPDVLDLLKRGQGGISAPDAARALFDISKPSQPQIEKARRKLDRFVENGDAIRIDAKPPDPVLYMPKERGCRG